MKLSDFRDEAALDLLADIIEPATSIFADSEIAELLRSNSKKTAVVKLAIKKHKKEVLEILAAMECVPVEKYSCNVFSLPLKLLEILNDKELTKLFTSAGQTGGATSSTSPTENTEASEQ